MFESLIKGKRVIFVGPSAVLMGGNNKKFINSFDVVIKTNGLGFIKPDLYDDYGDRCDILYVNIFFVRNNRDNMNIKHLVSTGVKMLCTKTEYKASFTDLSSMRTRVMRGLRDPNYFSYSPTMGSIIVNDILQEKPKSLHLMGLDFYKEEKAYVPTYQSPEAEVMINKMRKKEFRNDGDPVNKKAVHDINEDLTYIYSKFKTSGIITVDKNIKKIFIDYEFRTKKQRY